MAFSTSEIDAAFERLRDHSKRPPTTVHERRELLVRLRACVRDARPDIEEALQADFRKSETEVELTEIATTLLEIKTALHELGDWMAPTRIPAPFPFWSTKSRVVPQPKGVVLVISPWNYPILLSLAPLISAIAAGNRVILKPSERTPNTSDVLERLVERALGPDWCVVIQGDAEIGRHLLTKPFDHFFFTGSPGVGRKVMEAAAGHLSSVTLELGGKSPAIVDRQTNLEVAANKIATGKYLNAGQTCIAPDYVLVHRDCYGDLVAALEVAVRKLHASHRDTMTGVVDDRHAERLKEMWEDARMLGAKKSSGIELDLNTVSVITEVPEQSRLMREEIFGPLLPVVQFGSVDDILALTQQTGPPLTAYLFTRDEAFARQLEMRLKTGSVCRDETLLHFAHPELPFGGVGSSGQGRTHGRFGFETFSNGVSELRARAGISVIPLLFPVRGSREKTIRKWLIHWLER